jgi:repressor of nif and glnA expression
MEEELQFTSSRIDELMYGVDFNPKEGKGKIIVNLSVVHKRDLEGVLDVFKGAIHAGISVSPYVTLIEGRRLGFGRDEMCIGNVCSITIDGVLLKAGIPVNPRFGGVVEVSGGKPIRFTDMLLYEGTTIDPLEVLMSQELTSINEMLNTGSGKILANLREVPMVAMEAVDEMLSLLNSADFSGVIEVGEPNTEVLSVDVSRDHLGIVVVGGTNPAAAAIEQGYALKAHAMSLLMEYEELGHIDEL